MQPTFSAEVAAARAAGQPIVALESTLVAHGMPWPTNLEVARELEATVRAGGCVPATIAIVDGRVCVGLDDATLVRLARDGGTFVKAGAVDVAVHVARGESAATTVSATAVLAARAGIRVFATGGIGGVHRGDAMDVSHDLVALARTPIVVVSAGAKAILDLPRTLEALETLGVLVIGVGAGADAREFPAFYTRTSGLHVPHAVATGAELAAIARVHWDELGGGGVLACNPIPAAAAMDVAVIDGAIAEALAAAAAAGVGGKQLTPFLLAKLAAITGGKSIVANRALARHNAEVASHIAVALVSPSPA